MTAVIVRASIAPMHAEARVSSPQTSQRLAGHTVEVLEAAGEWLRVRGEFRERVEGFDSLGFTPDRDDTYSLSRFR